LILKTISRSSLTNTAGRSPSASNRFHKKLSRSSRGPCTRRYKSSTPLRVFGTEATGNGIGETGFVCRRPINIVVQGGLAMRILDKACLRLRSLWPPSECRVRARSRTSFPTWISLLKRTFHPVCRPRRPRRAAQRMIGGNRAIQGGVPGYAPRKLLSGILYKTHVTLHDFDL